jgi:hypothetical protein
MSDHPPTSVPPFLPPPARQRQSWLTTLGWAAYLACSWTWCIGMFLPVLLVRDFGTWGFVVFAVPNVVGAAAMGWVLRRAGAAARIRDSHSTAIRAFSIVTAVFQWFFILWLAASNLNAMRIIYSAPLVYFAAVVLPLVILGRRRNRTLVLTAATMAFSFGVATVLGIRGDLSLPTGMQGPFEAGLPFLAPVCAFGFLLCPYLDMSFLLARQEQRPRAGAFAFIIGFVVLFFPMILFTLFYASQFQSMGIPNRFVAPTSLAALLVASHMFGQVGATHHVHSIAWRRRDSDAFHESMTWLLLGTVSGVVVVVLELSADLVISGLTPGEVVYRLFMSFYGLIFPAYVWLCMIPVRGEAETRRPTRTKLTVFAVAVLLAAPCYWMGFIERQTWWLGPGLGIVLVARLFVPRATSALASAAAAGPSAPRSV